MPSCQAFNCTNEKGKCTKSFFVMPDPSKSADKKKLCKQWISNLKNGKLQIENFKFSSSKVVCEDHFTPDSFERNLVKESLDFLPKRKYLRQNAVPTIVNTGMDTRKTQERSTKSTQKRRSAQVKEEIKLFKKKRKAATCSTPSVSSETLTLQNQVEKETILSIENPKTATCSTPPVISETLPLQDQSIFSEPHGECSGQIEVLETVECSGQIEVPKTEDMVELHSQEPPNSSSILSVTYSGNACGHPCMMCLQANKIESSILTADHSYTKRIGPSTCTIGVNTDITMETTDKTLAIWPLTPIPKIPPSSISTPIKENDIFNSSIASHSFSDDKNDLTFDIDRDIQNSDENEGNESIDSDDSTAASDTQTCITNQRKFIVFETKLDQLFARLKCDECNCPVDLSDTKKDCSSGTIMRVSVFCTSGHLVYKWLSQPLIGNMPAGNLLVTAATMLCGQTYTHIAQFAEFMNLKFIGSSTYYTIQREIIMPVIAHTWTVIQGKLLDKVKASNRPLRLAGDGRCDSPGFNAKYCTYSLLDIETQHILAFVTIKVTETGSSSKMEVEGFRRCMEYLLDKGFQITVLATDRHVQIRSVMNKQYPETEHQFDVWHLAKSVRKKLQQKAKLRGAEDLAPWIKAICNHLWWCASNCNGDKEWLEESWVSIVHHVTNLHTFEGKAVTSCAHEEITPAIAEKKRWLVKDSKAHNALKEVILNKRLRKDIKHLSEFCHTGNLEVYHSLLLKYVPKRQEFDFDQMNARTSLAVIDHNMSQNRGKKIDAQGNEVYKTVYSKITAKWVAKPVYNTKTYKWVNTMMKMCVLQKAEMIFPKIDTKNQGNIAPVPAPEKAELVQNLISRFNKVCD